MRLSTLMSAVGLPLVTGLTVGCQSVEPRQEPNDEPRTTSQRQPAETPEGTEARLNRPPEEPSTENMPGDAPRRPPGTEEQRAMRASADLESAQGQEIDGEAEFTEQADGVKIVVRVEDTTPGKKGVHVHERGDCSDIAGQSMGSHFAPTADHHALPSEKEPGQRHLGDLGNITVGEDGKGRLEIVVPKASLQTGDRNSFLGRALVVHAGEDVGSAKQPSGGSGTPIACGVIEADT